MSRFRISTHGRLQDWIAVEKGYFEEEGLDYELDIKAQENQARTSRPIRPGTCVSARMSSTAPAVGARNT